jgi:uncharacterized Zn finger protein
MTSQHKSVSGLLSPAIIQELALPSNLRYGTAIYERGAVEFIEETAGKVEAWIGGLDGGLAEGGGSRRRTQLFASPEGLKWHCAGNPKKHQIFCKHCVALALAIVNRGSK